MRKILNLVVHHSVSNWGDGPVIVGWHTQPKPQGNGWRNPGYHVVIGNRFPTYDSWKRKEPVEGSDGKKDCILSEAEIANGCKYANSYSLHVCMIGNFDEYEPLVAQLERCVNLLAFWCKEHDLNPLDAIRGHGEMQKQIGREGYQKTCPGKFVNMDSIRVLVYALLLSDETEV